MTAVYAGNRARDPYPAPGGTSVRAFEAERDRAYGQIWKAALPASTGPHHRLIYNMAERFYKHGDAYFQFVARAHHRLGFPGPVRRSTPSSIRCTSLHGIERGIPARR